MGKIPEGLMRGALIIVLFIFCISVYFNSLSYTFVYDDNYLIVNNPYIKNPHFITKIFSESLYKPACEFLGPDYYRPLQAIVFMLDYRLWGLNPFGYHLTNVVIHFLNSVLICYLVYIIFKNLFIAVVSSLFFCVHPINVTAVGYISGSADLLATLFMLLVFLNIALSLKSHKPRLFPIILFSILALLSRENAVFMPLGILLLSLFIEGERKYKIKLFVSSILIVGLYLLFRVILLGMPITGYSSLSIKPCLKIINFLYVIISYVSMLIVPRNLHLMHTIPPILSPWDIRTWITLGFFAILVIIFYLKRKDKIFTFSLIWFFIFLIQTFFLMDKFSNSRLGIREHWVYFSSLGFYIIITYLFYRLKKYARVYINLFIVVLLLLYAALTIIDNANFRDEFVLSEQLLKFEPDNIEVHKILANIYLEKKEFDEAFFHIEKASKIDPGDPVIYYSKGRYYEDIGNTGLAIDSYERLLKMAPGSARANNNLGAVYFELGNYVKAEMLFKKAMALNPLLFEPYLNMAKLNYKNNNIGETIFFYKKAISLNPDAKDAFVELARIYIKDKQFKEAMLLLNKAMVLGHGDSSVLMLLGMVNDEIGVNDKALYYLKKALVLNPKSEEVMFNIGIFYAKHNQLDKALETWEEAIKVNPNNKVIKESIDKAKGLRQQDKR
jgi:tetratricopeptide (TPR) repeat protein